MYHDIVESIVGILEGTKQKILKGHFHKYFELKLRKYKELQEKELEDYIDEIYKKSCNITLQQSQKEKLKDITRALSWTFPQNIIVNKAQIILSVQPVKLCMFFKENPFFFNIFFKCPLSRTILFLEVQHFGSTSKILSQSSK